DGLALDCTSVRIDLVVDGEQRASGELLDQIAVIGFDHELLPGAHSCEHLGEIVFRNGENQGDGLELCNHGQAVVGVIGTHHIAHVNLAQSDTPGDGGG